MLNSLQSLIRTVIRTIFLKVLKELILRALPAHKINSFKENSFKKIIQSIAQSIVSNMVKILHPLRKINWSPVLDVFRNQKLFQQISFFLILLPLLVLSSGMGWELAQAATPKTINTVDQVPEQYELGQELYLENCATCHIGIPPEVFPSQTWANLLTDTQHYGVEVEPLTNPYRSLIWNYMEDFSRPILQNEEIPYRFNNSRYFRALHPKVDLPRPTTVSSCLECHPSAEDFNFRHLAMDFENAP
jgi:mono/diheme cytochrome c family protein